MTDRYFVEERRLGQWTPVVYHGAAPAKKTAGGAVRVFRKEPAKINPGHHRLTLSQQTEVYGVDGRFRGTNP